MSSGDMRAVSIGDQRPQSSFLDERAERRRGHGEAGRDGDLRRNQLAEGRALAAERGAVLTAKGGQALGMTGAGHSRIVTVPAVPSTRMRCPVLI